MMQERGEGFCIPRCRDLCNAGLFFFGENLDTYGVLEFFQQPSLKTKIETSKKITLWKIDNPSSSESNQLFRCYRC